MIWVGRGRRSIKSTFACVLIDADWKSASEDQKDGGSLEVLLKSDRPSPSLLARVRLWVEEVNDENVLEPAIIWRVPFLNPARWEAVVRTLLVLWWTIVVTLALRLTLVVVVHDDDEEDEDEDDDEDEDGGKLIKGRGEKEKGRWMKEKDVRGRRGHLNK